MENSNTMSQTFNIYCDESCHLPHDRQPAMLMGLLACPAERARNFNSELTKLCERHGLPKHFELKWTKISPGKVDFYRAVLEWFLSIPEISFRALVLPDKQGEYSRVPAEKQAHIYYALYFQLLRDAMEQGNHYRIYLDMKDTRGREKLRELQKGLALNNPSVWVEANPTLQHVRSHEIRLMQVTDLLLGAVGYARRETSGKISSAKKSLVSLLEKNLNYSLVGASPRGATKVIVNICAMTMP